jgi:septum formation protein
MTEELVLASGSVARARLLAAAGLNFRIEPAALDEASLKRAYQAEGRDAAACALALAESKAREVAARSRQAVVIGADQILVCSEAWFDKPVDVADARCQLCALRGRSHKLVTAACAVQGMTRLWHAISEPRLKMRRFSDAFLDRYLRSEESDILSSVGAYRIEGRGAQLFEQIDGEYFAVLGLPLLDLLAFLRDRDMLLS